MGTLSTMNSLTESLFARVGEKGGQRRCVEQARKGAGCGYGGVSAPIHLAWPILHLHSEGIRDSLLTFTAT